MKKGRPQVLDRRAILGRLPAIIGIIALLGCTAPEGQRRMPGDKPNVILIMADDVGVEGFGCYGGESYRTPVIDDLARNGVRFSHCHAQPLCTPSRIKLMTGQSNIRNYTHFSIMEPGLKTFGPMMQEAGYATAVAGKWQLLGTDKYGDLAGTGTHPRDAGFDEYCLWQIDRLGSRYWDPLIDRNGTTVENVEGRYGPDLFCDFILDFMDRHRDRPFFVYYPMALVHNPFVPTPDSNDREEGSADRKVDRGDLKQDGADEKKDKADRKKKNRQKNFADMMTYMDKIVGRIVERLEALGLRENTILLFTSDNGTNKSIESMRNGKVVKGGKGKTTDAGTHVPLVVSWPGGTRRGHVCEDLVDFSDFLPTLAEAAGADLPEDAVLDGRSFLPQVRGQPGNPREWVFCYYYPRPEREKTREEIFARDKRWKLYADGRLYDLKRDPREEVPVEAHTLEAHTLGAPHPKDAGDPAAARAPGAERARKKLRAVIDRYCSERPAKK